MMSNFNTFTITQPFLGAPLQFFPLLGSAELDNLIDAYVPGPAALQDKFSDVTIDFYSNAIVDLNTGALVKHYTVFPSFDEATFGLDANLDWALNDGSMWDSSPSGTMSLEQSPEQFLSNDFSDFDLFAGASGGMESPLLFTPSPLSNSSPASSAAASFSSFSDVGGAGVYACAATPAAPRNSVSGGRVTKKAPAARKESKRAVAIADEARLPGFSIMTKDGVDVTNSAGRGTKTKEQREHAHLMRIMKACDACKRKKVRCDPSHPRATMSSESLVNSANSSSSTSASSSPLEHSLRYASGIPGLHATVDRRSPLHDHSQHFASGIAGLHETADRRSSPQEHGQHFASDIPGLHDIVDRNRNRNRRPGDMGPSSPRDQQTGLGVILGFGSGSGSDVHSPVDSSSIHRSASSQRSSDSPGDFAHGHSSTFSSSGIPGLHATVDTNRTLVERSRSRSESQQPHGGLHLPSPVPSEQKSQALASSPRVESLDSAPLSSRAIAKNGQSTLGKKLVSISLPSSSTSASRERQLQLQSVSASGDSRFRTKPSTEQIESFATPRTSDYTGSHVSVTDTSDTLRRSSASCSVDSRLLVNVSNSSTSDIRSIRSIISDVKTVISTSLMPNGPSKQQPPATLMVSISKLLTTIIILVAMQYLFTTSTSMALGWSGRVDSLGYFGFESRQILQRTAASTNRPDGLFDGSMGSSSYNMQRFVEIM